MDELIKNINSQLEKQYIGDQLILIKKQVQLLLDVIQQTQLKYKFSQDYREAMDIVLGLIISGKLS